MGWVFNEISQYSEIWLEIYLNSQMMTRKMSRIYIFLEYPTDISYISHIYSISWNVPQIYYSKGYSMSWDVSQIYYLKGYPSQGLAKEISH